MNEFSHFHQILLNLFDVLKAFYDNIWVVYIVWHIFASMLWILFKTSNKLKKID